MDDSSEKGVDLLNQAIADCDAARLRKRLPHYMGALAEALLVRDRVDEAAATLQAAVARADAQNEQWCIPELLRVKASIAKARGRPDEAEATLVNAMKIAGELGALSWRLRAANDLAKVWLGGRRQEMHASCCCRFTTSSPKRSQCVTLRLPPTCSADRSAPRSMARARSPGRYRLKVPVRLTSKTAVVSVCQPMGLCSKVL